MDGAVFGLFKDKECTDCIEQKTTKYGVVQFENLKNIEMKLTIFLQLTAEEGLLIIIIAEACGVT